MEGDNWVVCLPVAVELFLLNVLEGPFTLTVGEKEMGKIR